ncbi:hypothetical protein BT96DRAFT_835393, partial [Gymnopus androsaceus JB14]
LQRIFGIEKWRFKILNTAPEYPFEAQSKLVPALAAVHNFICSKDPSDIGYGIGGVAAEHQIAQALRDREEDMDEDEEGELGSTVTAVERRRALERRDAIAKEMWDDYVAYTSEM